MLSGCPCSREKSKDTTTMTTYTTLTAPLRRKMNNDISRTPILIGTDRRTTKGKALNELASLMGRHGFTLDMVTGDLLLGDSGTRLLPFRVTHPESFNEHPEITNSRVSFSWHIEGDYTEITAYIS